MFHSAALKLTAWYLAIIMALSIGCSLAIYQLSRDQLINNTRRQVYFFNDVLDPSDFRSFSQLRQRQLDHGLNRLRGNLVLFNVLVLFGGGLAAYALSRRTLRPLEESLEAQKRFTADASHELRTPLTAMQTEIEVALRDSSLTKKQAVELLGSNLEEVAKLKALSDGLLKLASTGQQEMPKSSVSLEAAAADAIEKLKPVAAAKRVKLKQELSRVNVQGDHQSLADLIAILLDNAIKYSLSGAAVKLTVSSKGKEALVRVEDKGQGIKPSELPRIFERFYRTDTSRNKTGADGYGLGLAIAKKIAEAHGGYIQVASSPAKGSTFTLRMPKL